MANQFQDVVYRLSAYDPRDLLVTFAALQLLPENAGPLLRLEAYCHVAASLQHESGQRPITYRELTGLMQDDLLGSQIGHMEDPPESLFTDTITFDGGGYIVLPGMSSNSPCEVKNLCKALFLSRRRYPDAPFLKRMKDLIHASLIVSDGVAQRASLTRGLRPSSGGKGKISVPDESTLALLKSAVVLSGQELDIVLSSLASMVIDL